MAKKPDLKEQEIKEKIKKSKAPVSKFDSFVDKYFAPSSKADYMDIFTLAGLLLYGALKLVAKTRIKYKKWKHNARLTDAVKRKTDAIKASRNRNIASATSLDAMTPEVRDRARIVAKNMIKGKNPVAKGRDEESLTLDVAKAMQQESNSRNDQNAWVKGWRTNVEKELRDEIERGVKPAHSAQITKENMDIVNSDLYLTQQVNLRTEQYVKETVASDPSMDGRQDELRKAFFHLAYEQALTDREVMNEQYYWQVETRENMLNKLLNPEEAKDQVKEAAGAVAQGENRPAQAENRQAEVENRQPQAENIQAEVENRQPQAENIQANPEHQNPAGNAGNGNYGQNEIDAPKAEGQIMPRWWSGVVLDSYINTELQEPEKGVAESKEHKEFRESVKRLADATKDKGRNQDLLVNEYVDVYKKADNFNKYLKAHPDSPEMQQGGQLSQNITANLEYKNRINSYNKLYEMNQERVNDLAREVVKEQNAPEIDHAAVVKKPDKIEKFKGKIKEKNKEKKVHERNNRFHRTSQREEQMEREEALSFGGL